MVLQRSPPGGRCSGVPKGHPPPGTLPSRPVPRYGCEAPKIPGRASLKRCSFRCSHHLRSQLEGDTWTGVYPNKRWMDATAALVGVLGLSLPAIVHPWAHAQFLAQDAQHMACPGQRLKCMTSSRSLPACTGSWLLLKDAAHIYIVYISVWTAGPFTPQKSS